VTAPALLLVDDRKENLLALEAVLEPLGHRLVRAMSGEEALRHLLSDDIAVIVLDVQMPGLDGFETAAAIKGRERTRDIPIIFLTALSHENEHRLRGYATGAVDYIFKPVDPDLLRARVQVFLDLQLAQRRLREQAAELAARTAELERSNADLEQFSYIVAHDLREPLRAVAGYLELLDEDLRDSLDDRCQTWMSRATDAVTRMSDLIGDLLVYASSGAGRFETQPVDLDVALSAALDDLDVLVKEHDADVRATPLGQAMGAAADVRRIFQNLVANAVRYRGEETPVIDVDVQVVGDQVMVCISDNGVGVAPADRERVFGLFERVAEQPAPGTGLGLSVCRRLVERAGGRIWIDEHDGPGTSVRFTLPAVPS
jgi:two-component system, sensor histidine kinase and response regulator